MSADSEVIITREIKEFLETYNTIVSQLDYSYVGLSKAREQFPMSFLNKKGIEAHISKISTKNKKRVEDSNKVIKTAREKLTTLKKKMSSIDANNIEELESLMKEEKKLEQKILQARAETQLIRKLELEVSPERVTYFYEDLLLFVANCKHEALELWKYSCSVYEDIKLSEEHFSGRFLIDVAEDALRDKGYTKIIQDFRVAYLSSRTELKELKKIMGRSKVLRDATSKLLSALEADEVNFRKFTERSTKLGGI